MYLGGGVTDLGTAKAIARKLYSSYSGGGYFDGKAIQKMMVDTYKILNKDFKPTQQDIGICGSVLDFGGDGRITVEDFQNLAVKYLVKTDGRKYTKNVKKRLEVAQRLFEKFDTDKDGYLTSKQIPNVLKETYSIMGSEINPTKQDTDSWMQMTDLDGDGKVTLQDYQRLIINSLEQCGIKIYEKE